MKSKITLKIIGLSFILIPPLISSFQIAKSQSALLESVKRNPKEAKALCSKFKELNSLNKSAASKESILEISAQKNLDKVDAEVLAMYVRGLYCSEVF